jgi:hypothetical protein
MGFNFTALTSGEEEVITLDASETKPTSGFYLTQYTVDDDACSVALVAGSCPADDGTNATLYLTGSATEEPIVAPPVGVPEPGTLPLLGTGLAVMVLISSKRFGFRRGSLAE